MTKNIIYIDDFIGYDPEAVPEVFDWWFKCTFDYPSNIDLRCSTTNSRCDVSFTVYRRHSRSFHFFLDFLFKQFFCYEKIYDHKNHLKMTFEFEIKKQDGVNLESPTYEVTDWNRQDKEMIYEIEKLVRIDIVDINNPSWKNNRKENIKQWVNSSKDTISSFTFNLSLFYSTDI